jgi:hypothetical protein
VVVVDTARHYCRIGEVAARGLPTRHIMKRWWQWLCYEISRLIEKTGDFDLPKPRKECSCGNGSSDSSEKYPHRRRNHSTDRRS